MSRTHNQLLLCAFDPNNVASDGLSFVIRPDSPTISPLFVDHISKKRCVRSVNTLKHMS